MAIKREFLGPQHGMPKGLLPTGLTQAGGECDVEVHGRLFQLQPDQNATNR